ncbi:hypothetical protein Fcan01_03672 [Folsomia candida]|uniref:Gustatory receptor n=1 Tax=Folsomia candida TaxID=158441 RepID=A0A226F2W6_FOLCA|nr:hypothetical protein Fcan01_03672 [Folsomia candida]
MYSFSLFQRNYPQNLNKVANIEICNIPPEIEHELINIGQWAIEIVKGTGYFPFYIAKDASSRQSRSGAPIQILKKVQLQKLSRVSLFFGILHLLGAFFVLYGFWIAYKTTASVHSSLDTSSAKNSFSDEADNFIMTFNTMAMLIVCALIRTIYVISSAKTLKFWKQHIYILKGFYDLDILCGNAHFDRAKSKVRRFLAGFMCITILQTAVMFAYVQHMYQNKNNYGRWKHVYDDQYPLLAGGISICIVLFIHMHVGFFIWFGFLIQIYTTCFSAIGDAIIAEIANNDNTMGTEMWEESRRISWKDAVWNSAKLSNSGNHNHHKSVCASRNGAGERLQKLLLLFEEVCQLTEDFNQFYALPLTIDAFICITNFFASVYAINKMMYEYGMMYDSGGYSGSHHLWDKIVELLYRIPSHWAIACRVVYLGLSGNSLTQEALKVIQLLQQVAPKCRWMLRNYALQGQIQMLITRVSAKSPGISPGSYFTLNKAFLVSVRIELLTK